MNITKENYEKLLDLKEEFENKIMQILEEKCRLETGKTYQGYVDKMEYDSTNVEIETIVESRCSCCSDETNYYSFPVDYLFNEKWQEILRNQIQEKKEKEEKWKQEKLQKEIEEREKREREQYEKLKEKFEMEKAEDSLKRYLIVFYNRFACQTQTYRVQAKSVFHAGRMFYRKHNRKSYYDCIETIEEI